MVGRHQNQATLTFCVSTIKKPPHKGGRIDVFTWSKWRLSLNDSPKAKRACPDLSRSPSIVPYTRPPTVVPEYGAVCCNALHLILLPTWSDLEPYFQLGGCAPIGYTKLSASYSSPESRLIYVVLLTAFDRSKGANILAPLSLITFWRDKTVIDHSTYEIA